MEKNVEKSCHCCGHLGLYNCEPWERNDLHISVCLLCGRFTCYECFAVGKCQYQWRSLYCKRCERIAGADSGWDSEEYAEEDAVVTELQ